MEKSTIVDEDEATADFKFDWCEEGALADVKRQKGDVCWAYCTVATIEALNQIDTGVMTTFSEQYLIDCDDINKGYAPGQPRKAFKFIMKKNGVVYKDSDYEVIAAKGECKCDKYEPAATIDGYAKVPPHNEKELKKAVKRQPVTASIDARYILNYKKGIFTFDPSFDLDAVRLPRPIEAGKKPMHGVVIVGYGKENGVKYWKCRNTGGPKWGEAGYFRIERDVANHPDAFEIAKSCYFPWKKGVNEPTGQ